ncbi:hypothetical protein [Ruficoccus sp. ZRK36]|uniref:hypothetical protein n=1 Tax=Ruficoccus sp. ZRK36 TaxID=2866311 RepID=UPI001C72BACD|nr:hypothetical protein [Ruficoccus sp. ZRK36]QYY36569.1 hypothetical protein K0V07_03645 [Ruficoccus sp. ZRK36]
MQRAYRLYIAFFLVIVSNFVYQFIGEGPATLTYPILYLFAFYLLAEHDKGYVNVFAILFLAYSVFLTKTEYQLFDASVNQFGEFEGHTFTYLSISGIGATIATFVSIVSAPFILANTKLRDTLQIPVVRNALIMLGLVFAFHLFQKVIYFRSSGFNLITIKPIVPVAFLCMGAVAVSYGYTFRKFMVTFFPLSIIFCVLAVTTPLALTRTIFMGVIGASLLFIYLLNKRTAPSFLLAMLCLAVIAYGIVFATFWTKIYIIGFFFFYVLAKFNEKLLRPMLIFGFVFQLAMVFTVSSMDMDKYATKAYLEESRQKGDDRIGNLTSIGSFEELKNRLIFKATADRASVWRGQLNELWNNQPLHGAFPLPGAIYLFQGLDGKTAVWRTAPHNSFLLAWRYYGFAFGTLYLFALYYVAYKVLGCRSDPDPVVNALYKSLVLTIFTIGFSAGDYFISDTYVVIFLTILGIGIGHMHMKSAPYGPMPMQGPMPMPGPMPGPMPMPGRMPMPHRRPPPPHHRGPMH